MTDRPVLAAIDLTDAETAGTVIRQAAIEAEIRSAPLAAVAVVPALFTGLDWRYAIRGTHKAPPPEERRKLLKDTLERLVELVADETASDIETNTYALTGAVHERVLATAAELGARLIVIAAADTQTKSDDLGPNAVRVARHAKCPVLLVR